MKVSESLWHRVNTVPTFTVTKSLSQPFTLDVKLISFTNPFLHSLSDSFWTDFSDLELVRTLLSGHWCLFALVSSFFWLCVLD